MKLQQGMAVAGGAVLVLGIAVWLVSTRSAADEEQLAQGRALYSTHCAECHGENLEGAPDWQTPSPDGKLPPPPLDRTGHAPHHAEAELFEVVKHGMASVNGGKPTDMPAFADTLSDDEIGAVLAFIRSHW